MLNALLDEFDEGRLSGGVERFGNGEAKPRHD